MYLGTNKVDKLYLSSNEVTKAYLGSNVVHEEATIDYTKITAGTYAFNETIDFSMFNFADPFAITSIKFSCGNTDYIKIYLAASTTNRIYYIQLYDDSEMNSLVYDSGSGWSSGSLTIITVTEDTTVVEMFGQWFYTNTTKQ